MLKGWSPGRGDRTRTHDTLITLDRDNPRRYLEEEGATSDRAKGRHLTNPIYKELLNGRGKCRNFLLVYSSTNKSWG